MARLNVVSVAAIVGVAVLSLAAPASSQETAHESPSGPAPSLLSDGTLYSRLFDTQLFVLGPPPPAGRPALLPGLYATFIALEAFDGYSTSSGIGRGAVESNPLARAAVEHPGSLWALKGSAAALSIYAAERLWRRDHQRQAVAVMIASNVVMALVAANNYSVTHPR